MLCHCIYWMVCRSKGMDVGKITFLWEGMLYVYGHVCVWLHHDRYKRTQWIGDYYRPLRKPYKWQGEGKTLSLHPLVSMYIVYTYMYIMIDRFVVNHLLETTLWNWLLLMITDRWVYNFACIAYVLTYPCTLTVQPSWKGSVSNSSECTWCGECSWYGKANTSTYLICQPITLNERDTYIHTFIYTRTHTLNVCMCLYIIIVNPWFSYVQIYRTLRIRLVVVHVITWTSGDRINVVSDPNALLDNIRGYRGTVSQPHDSLMLLTYVCKL